MRVEPTKPYTGPVFHYTPGGVPTKEYTAPRAAAPAPPPNPYAGINIEIPQFEFQPVQQQQEPGWGQALGGVLGDVGMQVGNYFLSRRRAGRFEHAPASHNDVPIIVAPHRYQGAPKGDHVAAAFGHGGRITPELIGRKLLVGERGPEVAIGPNDEVQLLPERAEGIATREAIIMPLAEFHAFMQRKGLRSPFAVPAPSSSPAEYSGPKFSMPAYAGPRFDTQWVASQPPASTPGETDTSRLQPHEAAHLDAALDKSQSRGVILSSNSHLKASTSSLRRPCLLSTSSLSLCRSSRASPQSMSTPLRLRFVMARCRKNLHPLIFAALSLGLHLFNKPSRAISVPPLRWNKDKTLSPVQ